MEKGKNYNRKCKQDCGNWDTCVRRKLNLPMEVDMLVENCRHFEEKKDE